MANPDIQHVVVLMLENRSFDCMLGRLYPNDPDFKGLTLNESNTYANTRIPVWNCPVMTADTAVIPKPDPGEDFKDMNEQLFGGPRTANPPGNMSGFAQNYATQPPSKDGPFIPKNILHYFTTDQVPIISALATSFGVCDEWHASAPCQTWPNRFFVHCGTALGYVDNRTFPIPFSAHSIFRRLQDNGKSWRVYFHDMPQSSLLRDIWLYAIFHFRFFHQFLADAHAGALPNYSFIEPRYFTDLFLNNIPNDEHPPHNVLYGEQLIADVYNAVRSSPCWEKTLLIITYDEHGGCYDHVSPPPAPSPDGVVNNSFGFNFDAYGVRVPAVIVSPYIRAGTKIRSGGPYPFDHTSIISTVRQLFGLGAPLTRRDAAAPDLFSAFTLDLPTNNDLVSLDASRARAAIAELQTRAESPPNGMQDSLSAAATTLPTSPPATAADVPDPAQPAASPYVTVATAHANATVRTNLFLGVY
jgi:phospholipase C